MTPERDSECTLLAEEVDSVAVGTTPEPERTRLLAHAEQCERCSALLAQATAIADSLLQLAPEIDPPLGFESNAAFAMRPAAQTDRRRFRWAAVAAAVVIAAGVGFGAARVTTGEADDARAAIVARDGDRVGVAEIEKGGARVVLTMHGEQNWPGEWICQMRDDDGAWVDVGAWTADDVVHGVWAAGLPSDLAGSREMRILNDDRQVIATAAW